jgi:hypothetical protein
MDENTIQSIEGLLHKKIVLYHDLLQCFKQERESLMNIDLDELWRTSKKKEELCTMIQSARHEILACTCPRIDQEAFNLTQVLDFIPRDKRATCHTLFLTLTRIKSEIEVLRKENMIYIDDSIQLLDEIMSIITGNITGRMVYNEKCHLSKSSANTFLSREV